MRSTRLAVCLSALMTISSAYGQQSMKSWKEVAIPFVFSTQSTCSCLKFDMERKISGCQVRKLDSPIPRGSEIGEVIIRKFGAGSVGSQIALDGGYNSWENTLQVSISDINEPRRGTWCPAQDPAFVFSGEAIIKYRER